MRINKQGLVTIPADIRARAGFLAGTEVTIEHKGDGVIAIRRVKHRSVELIAQTKKGPRTALRQHTRS